MPEPHRSVNVHVVIGNRGVLGHVVRLIVVGLDGLLCRRGSERDVAVEGIDPLERRRRGEVAVEDGGSGALLAVVGAAGREAAEGVGKGVGAALVAVGEAARGGPAAAEEEGEAARRRLGAAHGLGQRVQVPELLVEQLHDLARELGEEVAVNLATQPGEAGRRDKGRVRVNAGHQELQIPRRGDVKGKCV